MLSEDTLKYQIIETDRQLQEAAKTLLSQKSIAVDLEADSMYHYQEKVCLLQLFADDTVLIVDPLAVPDLSVLKPVFSDPAIRKVFHGADYDIRSLYRDFKIKVDHLFDTQLAIRFLGDTETGLDAVLSKYFGVDLDKKYQKKDWSRRPLSEEMLTYAARDVLYLIPLANLLEQKLQQNNRLFWVEEENRILSRVRPNSIPQPEFFLSFKGAGHLPPRELEILENLLKLRQKMAFKKDRPPFKIMGSATLLSLVKNKPQTLQDLEKVKPLSSKQIRFYGPDLVRAVAVAMETPEEKLPRYPRRNAPTLKPVVRKRLKSLHDWREAAAARLNLDPALVCTKNLMAELAKANPGHVNELSRMNEMRLWQKAVFGEEIITALKGTAR